MDVRTGEIVNLADRNNVERFLADTGFKRIEQALDTGRLVRMKQDPTLEQMLRKPPRIKTGEKCGCGSGKLFRNCSMEITG